MSYILFDNCATCYKSSECTDYTKITETINEISKKEHSGFGNIYLECMENIKKDNLNFSEALELLKQGYKLARKGWNGKDMWVSLTKGKTLKSDGFWSKNNREFAETNGGEIETLPYLTLKTVDNKIHIGWLATQTDILGEDYYVVE